MIFKNLSENPQESTLVLTILGLILTQGLNIVETGVLGRIFIYLGEVVTTISILMAAKEAEEAVTKEKDMTVTSEDTITVDVDNIRKIINELQQQNQCLQDQIWALQEDLSSIQRKS